MNNVATWFKTVDLDDFHNRVEMLFYLGHAVSSSFPNFSDECKKAFVDECSCNKNGEVYQQATISLQKFSDLRPDAYFGKVTRKSVKNRFCPLPDIQSEAAQGRSYWGFHDLTVWHDMESLSDFDEKELYMQACNMWAEHTPLRFKFWENDNDFKPNVYAHARRIDGPGKILAWSRTPPANAGRNVQLEQRYDTSEAWRVLWQLLSTMAHEVGHVLGLDHSKNPLDLMYHTINGTKKPAPGDIAAIRAIYGRGNGDPIPDPEPDLGVEVVSVQQLGTLKDGRKLVIEYRLE